MFNNNYIIESQLNEIMNAYNLIKKIFDTKLKYKFLNLEKQIKYQSKIDEEINPPPF